MIFWNSHALLPKGYIWPTPTFNTQFKVGAFSLTHPKSGPGPYQRSWAVGTPVWQWVPAHRKHDLSSYKIPNLRSGSTNCWPTPL